MLRTLTLWADDGDPGGRATTHSTDGNPTAGLCRGDEVTYSIDVGADGSLETRDGAAPVAEFHVPAGTQSVTIAGHMTVDGNRIPFHIGEVPPQQAPRTCQCESCQPGRV